MLRRGTECVNNTRLEYISNGGTLGDSKMNRIGTNDQASVAFRSYLPFLERLGARESEIVAGRYLRHFVQSSRRVNPT